MSPLKRNCSLTIIIVFSVHCLISSPVFAAVTNITTDQHALLALKTHITHDPTKLLAKNWSASASVCDWIGVSCDVRHHRVTTLNISYFGLTGTLPPQLGNLSFLAALDVHNNSFYGSLPHELSELRQLKYINISYNNFNDIKIPSWLGSLPKLQRLSLCGNSFVGTIPSSIGNMTSMQQLDLSYNKLWGTIRSSIFNICSLQSLDLSDNQLSGSFPSLIFDLISLQMLNLRRNRLSGELSEDVFNFLPNLKSFDLFGNMFEGRIPSTLWKCKHLQILSLGRNYFGGELSREIGNLTKLEVITVSNNNLQGTIPDEIGNLRDLQELYLPINNFSGPIPVSIFNLSKLTFIYLFDNQLSGGLPSSMGLSLPKLEEFGVGINRLTGYIPSSISNASHLRLLELPENAFSGFIPLTLGNLRFLKWLNLYDNNLTVESPSSGIFFLSLQNLKHLKTFSLSLNPLNGVLPISIGNLSTSIEELYLSVCNFEGNIPSGIGNLSNLMTLDLSNNKLTGSIPNTIGRLQKLQGLYLLSNELQGSIPRDLCRLKSLNEFYLDDNRLSGSLPKCLDNLSFLGHLSLGFNRFISAVPSTIWTLTDILKLNLSSNSLNGSLPEEIGQLQVVTLIDLSSNKLSGDIPITFGRLKRLQHLSLADNVFQGLIPDSFGDLLSLEVLDLSNNNLSGTIPNSLVELLFLKYFNVSFNNLHGEIPEGGPFANFSAQSFIGNKALCGARHLHVPPCETKSQLHIKLLLFYVLSITALVLLFLAIMLVLIRHRTRKQRLPDGADMSSLELRRISCQELFRATDGFNESKLLGKGSFGSVYKGTLQDGMQVAIKVFHLHLEEGLRSFDAECEIMRNARHRNLVKIISSCSNDDFKALIMEYMPNGNLEKWLYDINSPFDILQGLNLAIDVASGLEYLHYGYFTPIIHSDLKPSNILLDENMVAHVSDFGIAKILVDENSTTQTQTLATIGYMAPEYGKEGRVSRKGDVYSYGIMLMEIFMRKKPTDDIFVGEMSIKCLVSSALNGSLMEIVDSNLLRRDDKYFSAKEKCVSSILSLAMECTTETPEKRINIKEVLTRLLKTRENLLANIE